MQAQEELRVTNSQLEQRVAERTTHLEEQRKELEQRNQELHELYRQLQQQSDKTVQAMEEVLDKDRMLVQQSRLAAMGELVMNIAHHWRQPLNHLGLIVQGLAMHGEGAREELEKKARDAMNLIAEMSRTIDDFGRLYRPQPQRERFTVNNLLSKMLEMWGGSFQELKLRLDVREETVVHGFGSANHFYQALLNILLNARDVFLERNVAEPVITIRIFQQDEKGVVTVADNAGGIAEDIIEKIFDPYVTTKGPRQGAGMGLYMAKSLLERDLNGSLSVRNIDSGAEFRIEIPMAPSY